MIAKIYNNHKIYFFVELTGKSRTIDFSGGLRTIYEAKPISKHFDFNAIERFYSISQVDVTLEELSKAQAYKNGLPIDRSLVLNNYQHKLKKDL